MRNCSEQVYANRPATGQFAVDHHVTNAAQESLTITEEGGQCQRNGGWVGRAWCHGGQGGAWRHSRGTVALTVAEVLVKASAIALPCPLPCSLDIHQAVDLSTETCTVSLAMRGQCTQCLQRNALKLLVACELFRNHFHTC